LTEADFAARAAKAAEHAAAQRAKARAEHAKGPRADAATLSVGLEALAAALTPTEAETRRVVAATRAVRRALGAGGGEGGPEGRDQGTLRRCHPAAGIPAGARVEMFGSAVNGLGVRSGNDVDLTIIAEDLLGLSDEVPEREKPPAAATVDSNRAAGPSGADGGGADGGDGPGSASADQAPGEGPKGGPSAGPGSGPRRPRVQSPRIQSYIELLSCAADALSAARVEDDSNGDGDDGDMPSTSAQAGAPAFHSLKLISTSRVPVLKGVHAVTGVNIDLTVNNLLASVADG